MEWSEFARRLGRELAGLERDTILIVRERDESRHYVQAMREPDRLYAEAVSNNFLEGPLLLTLADEEIMSDAGWRPPADPGPRNWWTELPEIGVPGGMRSVTGGDFSRLADVMVTALRDVQGVRRPSDLVYESFHRHGTGLIELVGFGIDVADPSRVSERRGPAGDPPGPPPAGAAPLDPLDPLATGTPPAGSPMPPQSPPAGQDGPNPYGTVDPNALAGPNPVAGGSLPFVNGSAPAAESAPGDSHQEPHHGSHHDDSHTAVDPFTAADLQAALDAGSLGGPMDDARLGPAEPPRPDPPHAPEPPRTPEPAQAPDPLPGPEPLPGAEPPFSGPPPVDPARAEPPWAEPPRDAEPPLADPPLAEPPPAEPRADLPPAEPPLTEPPLTEPPLTESPLTEAPRADLPPAVLPPAQPPLAEPPLAEPGRVEPRPAEPERQGPEQLGPEQAEPERLEPRPVEALPVEPQPLEPRRAEPAPPEARLPDAEHAHHGADASPPLGAPTGGRSGAAEQRPAGVPIRLPHGARLWRWNGEGDETHIARYDAVSDAWAPVGADAVPAPWTE